MSQPSCLSFRPIQLPASFFRVFAVSFMLATSPVMAQTSSNPTQNASPDDDEDEAPLAETSFRLGEIVNVLAPAVGMPGVVGGGIVTRQEAWRFERTTLDQTVNVVPGVSSTLDTNGRRNEMDIFVRGFGRWQVPLTVDGVRIYLPADNRLDFGRFLTADIAAVQIQKGYASVLDGPGAMGGAINLVTTRPTRKFEAEGGLTGAGRSDVQGSTGYVMLGSRQEKFYVQGSANYSDRGSWSLPGGYEPAARSLQPAGERISSDTKDWRANVKFGYTPSPGHEYAVNYITQEGSKGAPVNVYNNPLVPANSFWRWPYWNVDNLSFHGNTQLGTSSYLRTKLYRNAFQNGLDAFDDITYTLRQAAQRFSSPYDDHAYGGTAEFGTTPTPKDTIKASVYYRTDVHKEAQVTRPDHPTLRVEEPTQTQSQNTWSIALENTFHPTAAFDVVAGVSFDKHETTKAEEYDLPGRGGLFEFPMFDREAFNWQVAGIWRYNQSGSIHAGVSDRARFPMIFELFSARMGSATPNPQLGPERSRNIELGWNGRIGGRTTLESTVFYSDISDLVQNVQLPDNTVQYQNVGTGEFFGVELGVTTRASDRVTAGANYTFIDRTIRDGLQPNLRPTGVPTHKAFLYASVRPFNRLTITPSLDIAGDRWSDIATMPVQPFPYTRVGSYNLLTLDGAVAVSRQLELSLGFKNLLDDQYELAWGYPQQGRTFYVRTRVTY